MLEKLFSINEDNNHKIVRILGVKFKFKINYMNFKFIHNLESEDFIRDKNIYEQSLISIKSTVYREMMQMLDYLAASSIKDDTLYNTIKMHSEQYGVSYKTYVQDSYNYYRFIKKVDRTKIKSATGKLRIYQLESAKYCATMLSELEQETGIKAIIFYGSLLGAKYHNGFIPWDEDVDFVLMRDDYEKAVEYFTTKYPVVDCTNWNWSNYMNELIKNFDKYKNKTFCFKMPICFKLIKGTIRDFKVIDIFSMDNYPNKFKKKDYQNYINEISKKRGNKSFGELSELIDHLIKNDPIINKRTDRIYYGIDNFTFFAYKYRKYFLKSDIFPLKQIDFEGMKFWAPHNIDKCLEKIYGDFKTIPLTVKSKHFEEYKEISKELLADIVE